MYNIDSPLNDINKNIKILSSSDLNKNSIILASHSGNSKNAYFNNLNNLENNDLIYIYHNNKKYAYQINKIYYIDKNGYLEIPEIMSNTLILITCSLKYKNKQLIIISKLVS